MCGAGGGMARGGGRRAHELRPGVRRPAVGSGESGGGRIGGAAVAGGGGEEVAAVEVLGGGEDQWRWGRASSGLGAPRDGVSRGSSSPEWRNGGEAARRKVARAACGRAAEGAGAAGRGTGPSRERGRGRGSPGTQRPAADRVMGRAAARRGRHGSWRRSAMEARGAGRRVGAAQGSRRRNRSSVAPRRPNRSSVAPRRQKNQPVLARGGDLLWFQ